jgi:5-hydroxyisourate hydrolase
MSSPLTTHVLDVSRGLPAQGVPVRLDRRETSGQGEWTVLAEGATNADGRCADLLNAGALTRGVYRLAFDTRAYFEAQGQKGFYPVVEIVFDVSDERHHHVPLLLSPFGYSTYRGS